MKGIQIVIEDGELRTKRMSPVCVEQLVDHGFSLRQCHDLSAWWFSILASFWNLKELPGSQLSDKMTLTCIRQVKSPPGKRSGY